MQKNDWTVLEPNATGTGFLIPGQPITRKQPLLSRPWLARTAAWCSNEMRHRINSAINQYHIMKNEFVTNVHGSDSSNSVALFNYPHDRSKYFVKKIDASIVWSIKWKTGSAGITGYTVKIKSLSLFIDLWTLPGVNDVMAKTDAVNLIKAGFSIQADVTFRHTANAHKLSPTFVFADFGNKTVSVN